MSYNLNALYILKSSLLSGIEQTKWVHSYDDRGRVYYQYYKFHDPFGRGSCAMVWPDKLFSEMHYFYDNILLYPGAWFRQTKRIVVMTEEESTNIVNFFTPGVGLLVLSCCHIRYIVQINYLLYSQVQIRQTEGILIISSERSK